MPPTRRDFLRFAGAASAISALGVHSTRATSAPPGAVAGDPIAAKLGETILHDGGNAIDAAIASAFAACICSPSKCGLGGYGGHAIIGLAGGKKIVAIDF